MINTNLLLSIGYSIVTNFAHLVPIPEKDIPMAPSDLRIYAVGPGHSPVDFRMVNRASGANYEVVDAVVQYFQSAQDYFLEQEPRRIGKYDGASVFTSSEVVYQSSNILQRLIRTGAPLTNGPSEIRQAGVFEGHRIPFFRIDWPPPSGRKGPVGARMDIDGRTGKVVLLNLLDTPFLDFEGTKLLSS